MILFAEQIREILYYAMVTLKLVLIFQDWLLEWLFNVKEWSVED